MSLSKKQKEIVETEYPKVIVNSSAASGKTATLTERVKFLLNKKIDPNKIVVITFTNAAADEMRERIGMFPGLFIGTIHSYANYLLISSGHETEEYLNEENFDKLFEEVSMYPDCVKEVEHLLIDEGQDTTKQQFYFLLDMVKPKNWIIFADHKQSIYRWNGAEPQYIIDLMRESDVYTYDLNENYRNGKSILTFAKSIIRLNGMDYYDKSIPMRKENGKVVEVVCSYKPLVEGIKKIGNYGSWFVLTRTNSQIEDICEHLEDMGIPYTVFKKKGLSNQEINERLKEDKVKVMTIHMSKGLETENVMVIGANFYNVEEKCISYVAATRAKNLLVWTREKKKKKRDIEMWE